MKSDFRDVVVGFVVFLIVITFAVLVFSNIHYKSKEGNANIARCKSLQGEYGGGKCFKDGKEI